MLARFFGSSSRNLEGYPGACHMCAAGQGVQESATVTHGHSPSDDRDRRSRRSAARPRNQTSKLVMRVRFPSSAPAAQSHISNAFIVAYGVSVPVACPTAGSHGRSTRPAAARRGTAQGLTWTALGQKISRARAASALSASARHAASAQALGVPRITATGQWQWVTQCSLTEPRSMPANSPWP